MSVEVCGPNVAMVKTGMCTGGKQIIVGGCTCFWPCCQELHRMELAVMTVVVHSSNVVTAEGVEITAEGLTQVRIDPGMAEDQADAMIDARNEDIEHKVEEVIREKLLYNKSRGEDEQVKGVPGVTDVKVVTLTHEDDGVVNLGKKRLCAFVGPPTNKVVERVYTECHRKLAGSGMMPYWVIAMPQQTSEATYDKNELDLLVANGWKEGQAKREVFEKFAATPSMQVQAAIKSYGPITEINHPSHEQVYKATGYWPGSMGPVQLYITDIDGAEQTFMSSTGGAPIFHPWAEPNCSATVLQLKELLFRTAFNSMSGESMCSAVPAFNVRARHRA